MVESHASESGVRLRRQAQHYLDSGQMVAAQTALESILQRTPHDVVARMELARVMLQQGRMRASTRQLLQIAWNDVPNAQLLFQLVQRLHFHGEMVAAKAGLDCLEQAPDPPAQMLFAQANLRLMLGQITKALERMERAVAAGGGLPDAGFLHGLLLQFTGHADRAAEVYQACLRRAPQVARAAVMLANLRTQTPESNHLDFLRARAQGVSSDSKAPDARRARAEYESAIFKTLDDLGRHDEAWPALARANALMHALNPYDAAAETALTDTIISASDTSGDVDSAASATFDGPTPIFIVGMPRSGTTLLDRMLSNHSEVVSAGEINDFMRQLHWVADVPPGGSQGMQKAIRIGADGNLAELGARYLEQTQWRARGHRFYIDKLPANVQMVAFIRRALPHAPILHMVRDPMDVCFSNFKAMFGNASAYSYDMQALAHYYGQYVRLAEHWRNAIPGAMLDVSYAALVDDPDRILGQVLEYCQLEAEDACLRPERNTSPISTPSSAQVQEPIHARSLGQWRHYATQLEPLRRMLGEAR